ncbi:MAG TPA: nitroreductase family protein [Candidatus Nanoarchaeia archaeon]|nr:nitroreductase family protein [Candidatus Nanoarchaeia archaeon]
MGHNFLNLAKNRKTTYEFNSKKISKENILKILEAARWTPSCGNLQPWHFIVVRDQSKIRKLIDTTHYVYAPFIHPLPPVVVAFVLLKDKYLQKHQNHSVLECCKHGGCEQHKNELDLCFAMSVYGAVLSAADLGIQSCILTPKQDLASHLLKTDSIGTVRLIVGLGYELKPAFKRERSRVPLKNLVSYERYWRKNDS